MITSAGRLSSTISQGSPRRSATPDRPLIRPSSEPSAMAMTKATATRASVVPRLKASAPERASSTIAIATACGSGSMRAPASCEPAYQAAINSASETSRATKFLRSSCSEAREVEAHIRHALGLLPPPLWGRDGEVGVVAQDGSATTTPTPNPSPQGGGEQTSACCAVVPQSHCSGKRLRLLLQYSPISYSA